MAFTPTDISRYGKRVEVLGMRQLQARVKELTSALSPEEKHAAGASLKEVVADVADDLYAQLKASAAAAGVPRAAQKDIFSYKRQPPGLAQRLVSALVGVRKRGRMIGAAEDRQIVRKGQTINRKWAAHGYVEWYPGSKGFAKPLRRKGSRRVAPGTVSARGLKFGRQLIGESLATMWEIGTTKMAARPWFRPVIRAAASGVRMQIAAGLQRIIDSVLQRAA